MFISLAGLVSRSQVKHWFNNKRKRTNRTRPKSTKLQLENREMHLCEYIHQTRCEASDGTCCTSSASSVPSGFTSSKDTGSAVGAATSRLPFYSSPMQLASTGASASAAASASTSAVDFDGSDGLPLYCARGPSASRTHQSISGFDFGAKAGAERIEQPMRSYPNASDRMSSRLPAIEASFFAGSSAEAPTKPEDTSDTTNAAKQFASASKS